MSEHKYDAQRYAHMSMMSAKQQYPFDVEMDTFGGRVVIGKDGFRMAIGRHEWEACRCEPYMMEELVKNFFHRQREYEHSQMRSMSAWAQTGIAPMTQQQAKEMLQQSPAPPPPKPPKPHEDPKKLILLVKNG